MHVETQQTFTTFTHPPLALHNPTNDDLSVAITCLGQAGKWREAVEVLDGMGKGGNGSDRPDAFAYAATINACGKAGRPVEVR